MTPPTKNDLPTRRKTPISVALWTLMLCLFAAMTPALAGTEFSLKSGAEVQAEVLKRTDDRVVLDLGFDVLTVPTDAIASEREPGATDATATAKNGDAVAVAAGVTLAAASPRRTGNFRDYVEELEASVVVVSNPHGFGAGFIIDSSGLIVTNHHVIRGEKHNDVTVYLQKENGEKEKKVFKKVEVRGFSSLFDCALLKISDEDLEGIALPTLPLAESNTIKTGIAVYAIGNPGVGATMLKHTVSEGILSSTDRNFNDILYLQTTAAVNPGNSGGPLMNRFGEVVGLVTFRAVWQEGLAFALPVSYLNHFIHNVEAFAPGDDSENTGYRYHNPMGEEE